MLKKIKKRMIKMRDLNNFRICTKCNNGLGSFKDNVSLLKKAIKYLEEHQEVTYRRAAIN